MKTPAFLFYSKDFYTSTRLMTPEERAAFIDLLIMQHLYGEIPDDMNKIKSFCTGIDEHVLQHVLQQKFQQTATGVKNLFLEKVTKKRQNFTEKRKKAGKLSAFWRFVQKKLSAAEYKKLKKHVEKNNCNDLIINKLNEFEKTNKQVLEQVLQHVLGLCHNTCCNNIYENENENENNIQGGIIKGGNATKSDFVGHCAEICSPKLQAKWREWKRYKAEEFGFEYKSAVSEKTAINKLLKLAAGKDETAIAIINQSISNGWKGFFQLNQPAEKPHETGPKNFGVKKNAERAKKLLEKIKNK